MKRYLFPILILFFFIYGNHTTFADESRENPKTVFLTGAAGFIGSNFLHYMFEKYPEYNFIVLDALTYAGFLENIPDYIQQSNRYQFFHGSVINAELVDQLMAQADYVVHFAAETHVARSIEDDYVFFETDVMGTRAMMASLVKYKSKIERFIHISTSEVYGTAQYEPMDETHPLNPRSPYAAAKAAADRLVYAYWCTYDVPAVIVRPFNNYGPRQHPEKMIPHFIISAIEGKPLTIHGNGAQKRDWIHTHDVCEALDGLLHAENFAEIKNQEINIGTGKAVSVIDIANHILQYFNLNKEAHLTSTTERPGQVACHIGSIDKIYNLIGWKPKIDISDGLKNTISWYIENSSYWKKINQNEKAQKELVTSNSM